MHTYIFFTHKYPHHEIKIWCISYTCSIFRSIFLSWITITVGHFPNTSCLMHCRIFGWWFIGHQCAITFHVYVEVDQLEIFLFDFKINTNSVHANSWEGSTEDWYKITQPYSQPLIMYFSLFSRIFLMRHYHLTNSIKKTPKPIKIAAIFYATELTAWIVDHNRIEKSDENLIGLCIWLWELN